ncbi:hypothetical protein ACPXAO_23940, partial [Salmonella enterica]|uniref:hypothetical protein n=1 Tax=Salmonella enterica TaxID=28901 RepID=UPI003CF2E7F1
HAVYIGPKKVLMWLTKQDIADMGVAYWTRMASQRPGLSNARRFRFETGLSEIDGGKLSDYFDVEAATS